MANGEDLACFLCKTDFKTANILVSIGEEDLLICPNCLKNIDIDKMSVFSITKDDIEKCKYEYDFTVVCGCGVSRLFPIARTESWVYEPTN